MAEGGTRPHASRWAEIVTGLVVALLVIGIVAFYPPVRDGLDSARRSVASLFGVADWTGYYLELDPTALPGEVSSPQVVFTSGSFPGRGVRVVDPPVFAGRWSPSGDRFAFTSASRLLTADKNGAVRSLGELLDLVPAGPPVWAHDNEIVLTMSRPGSDGWWYVRIDPNSGLLLDQRALPQHLTIDSLSSDGRFALAMTLRATRDLPRANLALYELDGGRERFEPEGADFAGWSPDGRILVRVRAGESWRLEAREVGSTTGQVLAEREGVFDVPVAVRGGWVVLIERDSTGGSNSASIWLVRRDADARRVATDIRDLAEAWPSSDGRYVAFTTVQDPDGARVARTGLIEVASGRITYACEVGCAALRLR